MKLPFMFHAHPQLAQGSFMHVAPQESLVAPWVQAVCATGMGAGSWHVEHPHAVTLETWTSGTTVVVTTVAGCAGTLQQSEHQFSWHVQLWHGYEGQLQLEHQLWCDGHHGHQLWCPCPQPLHRLRPITEPTRAARVARARANFIVLVLVVRREEVGKFVRV